MDRRILLLPLLVVLGGLACSRPQENREVRDRRAAAEPPLRGYQDREEAADPDLPLRAVSLRVLQRRLEICVPRKRCPEELLSFGRLTQILGYSLDEANSDIVIYGLADPTLPRLHVDDFVIALRNSWHRYARRQGNTLEYTYPGCDIRPAPDLVRRMGEASRRLDRSSGGETEAAIDHWEKTCESLQKLSIFGVPFDSHFGQVMGKADYDMKRLADGSDKLDIPGLVSAADLDFRQAEQAIRQGGPVTMKAGMSRFWLTPGEQVYDEADGIIWLRSSPVEIRTHAIAANAAGGLGDIKRSDPAAEEFARRFTALYDQVAEQRPVYRELQGLFHLFALTQILRARNEPSVVGLDLGYFLDRHPLTKTAVPRQVPGRHRVQRLRHERPVPGGTETVLFWMPSCGGVDMAIQPAAEQFRRLDSDVLTQLQTRAHQSRPKALPASWPVKLLGYLRAAVLHHRQLQKIHRPGSPLVLTVEYRDSQYHVSFADGYEFRTLDTVKLLEDVSRRLAAQQEAGTLYLELKGFPAPRADAFTATCKGHLRRLQPNAEIRSLQNLEGELESQILFSPGMERAPGSRPPYLVTEGPFQGFYGALLKIRAKASHFAAIAVFSRSREVVQRAYELLDSAFSLTGSTELSPAELVDRTRRQVKRDFGDLARDLIIQFETEAAGSLIVDLRSSSAEEAV